MHKTAHPMQWAIVALFGIYLLGDLAIAGTGDPEKGFHLHEFGCLPVVEGGRVKPMDTFARSRLMIINKTQTYRDDNGDVHPATEWLLDTMLCGAKNGPGVEHKIFRIENLELLGLLHLEERPGKWRYGYREFMAHVDDLDREAKRAKDVAQRDRSLFDLKVLELAEHVDMFIRICALASPGIVPTTGDWLPLGRTLGDAQRFGRNPDPITLAMSDVLRAYANKDVLEFNAAVKDYQKEIEQTLKLLDKPNAMSTIRLESYFNEAAPFYHCAILYGIVFLLACMSWLGWFPTLNRAAFWSMLLILAVHTWALFIRMYIQDRPLVFVTNLYSSAVFIGWGCVVICLFVEYFFRNSIALAVGAATGGLTLLIAHLLSLESGDTMEMMQAVLDTNFWLATHVTCVTLGYTATFVAGFMGIVYVAAMASTALLDWLADRADGVRRFLEGPDSRQGARSFFTHFFDKDAAPILGKMIYGVVCFGMLLSFTGTVLGGLWADYSWGRFWGWDPKENGALLIVIWCALILHARWGGMVKNRGIAVLAVLGNIVTSWSWFGTNFLGVGLHSYGFMEGAMSWLIRWDLLMLVIAGIGMLPLQRWAMLRPRP